MVTSRVYVFLKRELGVYYVDFASLTLTGNEKKLLGLVEGCTIVNSLGTTNQSTYALADLYTRLLKKVVIIQHPFYSTSIFTILTEKLNCLNHV